MDRIQDYISDSLELHLFFARIMKEHAFFLTVGFLPPDADSARESEHLLRQFEALLSRAISLGNHVVRRPVLVSGELVTDFTDSAECQTAQFTGICLDRGLTARVKQLTACSDNVRFCISRNFLFQVRQLNRDGLRLVNSLIDFKERLLCRVNSCSTFTGNYPLLIEHILREARLYRSHLMRLEGFSDRSLQELVDSELFWNQIMMEHALFIRGLLDPGEDALVNAADQFAGQYRRLLAAAAQADERTLLNAPCEPADDIASLELTRKFRDFKQAGVEGIEACRIRSIILPLLADHVLREANHYIRLLEA